VRGQGGRRTAASSRLGRSQTAARSGPGQERKRPGWRLHAIRAWPGSPSPPSGPRAGPVRVDWPVGPGRLRRYLPRTGAGVVDGADEPPHALRRLTACRQPGCPSAARLWPGVVRCRARRACRASRDQQARVCRSLARSAIRASASAGFTVPSRGWARGPGRSPLRIVLRRPAAHQAYALSMGLLPRLRTQVRVRPRVPA